MERAGFSLALVPPVRPGHPEPIKSLACVSPTQPLFFPVDASCSGVFRPRPVSPSSLLDTAISEEARQGPGLEEEQDVQESLPSSTGRRHTLAEVSTRLSPLIAPCKCPRRPRRTPVDRLTVDVRVG